MKLIAIACTAIVSLMPLVSANAETPKFRTQTVGFADLDLSHSEGLAALFHRVESAAQAVCADPDSRMLMKEHSDCVHRAMANAVQSIQRPEFVAYVTALGLSVGAAQIASR
jgi:UrcA family protein